MPFTQVLMLAMVAVSAVQVLGSATGVFFWIALAFIGLAVGYGAWSLLASSGRVRPPPGAALFARPSQQGFDGQSGGPSSTIAPTVITARPDDGKRKPKTSLSEVEVRSVNVQRLTDALRAEVFGHDERMAILARSVANALAAALRRKPALVVVLIGDNGVGKGHVAGRLAALLERPLHTLDMSAYSRGDDSWSLRGPAAGYQGHIDGGLLARHISGADRSVFLFDNLRPTCPRPILDDLASTFRSGLIEDRSGDRTDCRNTVFVMSTSIGARALARLDMDNPDDMRRHIVATLQAEGVPETLLETVDLFLPLAPLTRDSLLRVVTLAFDAEASAQGLSVTKGGVSREAAHHVVDRVLRASAVEGCGSASAAARLASQLTGVQMLEIAKRGHKAITIALQDGAVTVTPAE